MFGSRVGLVACLVLLCADRASSSHFQQYCNSQKKTNAFGTNCLPLPCDGTMLPAAMCSFTVKVGDVVVGANAVFYGMVGTVVCESAAGSFLILWDHYFAGLSHTDADPTMHCTGCADPYMTLTTRQQLWWMACKDLVPHAGTPVPPVPWVNTPSPVNVSKDDREVHVVWGNPTLYPTSVVVPPNTITNPAGPLVAYIGVNLGPVTVQTILPAGMSAVELYGTCQISAGNATVFTPQHTVELNRGVAVFDPLTVQADAMYLNNPTQVALAVTCTPRAGTLGYNVSQDTTIIPLDVNAQPAATAVPATPVPPPPTLEPAQFTMVPPKLGNLTFAPADCARDPKLCPFDCHVADWSPWSVCNGTCGAYSVLTRYRTVLKPERHGGTPCSDYSLFETSPCNRFECGHMCVHEIKGDGSTAGSPGDWTCGHYSSIRSPQMYQNGSTSLSVVAGCAALKPGVSTNAVFHFEDANVSLSVSDPIQVTLSAGSVGTSCNLINTRPCVRIAAQVSKYGDGPWETCGVYDHTDHKGMEYEGGAHASVQCESPFRTNRLFVRMVPEPVISPGTLGAGAVVGGQAFPAGWGNPAQDVRPDGHPYGGFMGSGQYSTVFLTRVKVSAPCVRNCILSEWGPWSACSNPCNGGRKTRSRLVLVSAQNGGAECAPTSETVACNSDHCNQDCEFTAYSIWGDCSVSCGGGVQQRSREIVHHASASGVPCPAELVETRPCNPDPCGEDCQVTGWSDWQDCTATCGGGVSTRLRFVVRNGTASGEPCPHLKESRPCGTDPCPAVPQAGLSPDFGLTPELISPDAGGGNTDDTPAPPGTDTDSPDLPPVYTGPLLRVRFADSPVEVPAPGRVEEVLGEDLAAFVVAMDALSWTTLDELPAGVEAFVDVASLDTRFNVSGTTRVRLSGAGTAAFTDLRLNTDDADAAGRVTPVDLMFSVVLVPDTPEVRAAPLFRRLRVAPAPSQPRSSDPAWSGRYVVAAYNAAVESFDAAAWRTGVAAALSVDAADVELVAVREDAGGVPGLVGAMCASAGGGGGGGGGGRSIVVFRVKGDADDSAEDAFLKGSLLPGNPLSKLGCGAAYAFSGYAADPRVRPYLDSAGEHLTFSPPPTPVPEEPASTNWALLLGILLPLLCLSWVAAAFLLYKAKGALLAQDNGEAKGETKATPEDSAEGTSEEGAAHPLQPHGSGGSGGQHGENPIDSVFGRPVNPQSPL